MQRKGMLTSSSPCRCRQEQQAQDSRTSIHPGKPAGDFYYPSRLPGGAWIELALSFSLNGARADTTCSQHNISQKGALIGAAPAGYIYHPSKTPVTSRPPPKTLLLSKFGSEAGTRRQYKTSSLRTAADLT